MAPSDISGLNGKVWGEAVGLVLDRDLGKLTFARWDGLAGSGSSPFKPTIISVAFKSLI